MFERIFRRLVVGRLVKSVKKLGWTGMYSPGDDDQASLFYSVGFWRTAANAEIVIFGVDPGSGHSLLFDAKQQIETGTLRLADQTGWEVDWGEDVGRVRLMWRAVHPSQIIPRYFDAALAYKQAAGPAKPDFEAFQLVFPDRSGAFPWEDAFDRDYRPQQPELYLARTEASA